MITDGTQAVMAAPGRGERFVHSNPPFFEGIFVCCPASGALARTVDQAALGQCRRSRPRAARATQWLGARPRRNQVGSVGDVKMSGEIKDLVSLIDTRGLECLNEQTDHPIRNAVEDVSTHNISLPFKPVFAELFVGSLCG